MPQYGAYVKFTAKPGQRDALVDLLLEAAKQVEGAAGCNLYLINTSADDPDAVWVTEVWETEADSRLPLSTEGAQANIQRVLALLAAPPQKTTLQVIGGKGLPRA